MPNETGFLVSQSILLELQNGAFFWLAMCSAIIFLRYMYKNFDMGYRFLQGAIALLTVWLGQTIIRGSLWATRYQVNLGEKKEIPDELIMLGSMFCILGFLCVIRIFSDEDWKPWAWKASLAGGVVFLTASYYKVLPL